MTRFTRGARIGPGFTLKNAKTHDARRLHGAKVNMSRLHGPSFVRMTSRTRTPLLTVRALRRMQPDGADMLLSGACLELYAGERLAIMGPSGSGKTVLLRAIAMLDPIDEGTIRFKGRAIPCEAVPAYRSEVVYLHQRPALLDGSVAANLEHPFTLMIHRKRRFDPKRIVDLLVGLGRDEAFLAKSSRELSGGEAQIVALLRAMQLDPTVLLLDEPTASLDKNAALAIEGLIGRWIEEDPNGRAIVWVSHDRDQAHRVSGRRLAMDAGRLESEG
jgi:putative ABC transport system ATP-binding protein